MRANERIPIFSPRQDRCQICLNGHVGNRYAVSQPIFNSSFCRHCGAKTIHECQNYECQAPIEGGSLAPVVAPAYCHHCGRPYPWTAAKIKAAEDYADMLDTLSEAQRLSLKSTIPDLLCELPRTLVSAERAKRILKASGESALIGFRSIISDAIAKTAKHVLNGD